MKTSLVVFFLVAMQLPVQPGIACKFDECTAECTQQKNQCLEQLAMTLDQEKQDAINAECDSNYKKCFHDCAIECTETKNMFELLEKRQSEKVASNILCLAPR
jgi:hypothetical protein